MKALVLAAGRGERMRPLSDQTPKPLLQANKRSLIEHRLLALKAAGITDCVINISYKGEQIQQALGNGDQLGLKIIYSDEGEQALESAGGIIHALPLLGDKPFVVVNADIWTDFDFSTLPKQPDLSAFLILVDNPAHHLAGDFSIDNNGIINRDGDKKFTFSGIGVYHPRLFKRYTPGVRSLLPVLLDAMQEGQVGGRYYQGRWLDIGTPERLNALRNMLE